MASASDELKNQLEALNRMWMEAYIKRDSAFLQRHLRDDYVSTFPDGTVLDKRGEIEALTSGAVVLSEMTANEMKVQLYRDTAVITGRSTIKASVKGHDESGEYRFTDVWVREAGHWRAAASQVTRITAR
jgi:ketosteroid isomerase-like protein